LNLIVPLDPVSSIAIDVSPICKADVCNTDAVKIPLTLRFPVMLVSLEPPGFMLMSPLDEIRSLDES